MSQRVIERLKVMAGVEREALTLVQARELLGLSYRQTKRVRRRYQEQGYPGFVHRLGGHKRGRGAAKGGPGDGGR